MNIVKWGYSYYKKRMPVAIICQIMGEIAILISLLLPLLTQLIIDGVVNYKAGDEVSASPIFSFLLNGSYGELGSFKLFLNIAYFLMALVLIRTILAYIRNIWFRHNGMKFENEMRYMLYNKLFRLSNKALASYNTGDLMTTIDSDVVNFKEFFNFYTLLIIDSVFVLVVVALILYSIQWQLLLIIAALAPFLIYFLRKYVKISRQVSLNIRERNAEMNLVAQESVNGIRLIKAYANEEHEMERFHECNQNTRDAFFRQVSVQSKYNVLFNSLRQIAYVSSIALCGFFAIKGTLKIGELVACTSYVMSFMTQVTNLNNYFFAIQLQLVSGERVRDFLNAEEIKDTHAVAKIENYDISIENVTVNIDGNDVLKNISLNIPYGMKLGVMGSTGSGKSVFLKALSDIISPTSGVIKLGGRDITEYDKEELRQQFSYVFQDVFLFSNTIDANIAFASPDASFEQIVAAAKLSKAHGFIKHMPSGYDTIIGEKGLGLSGGQKQRISVARAIVKDSPIFVLDDVTSALDRNTEKELLETLKTHYADRTLIISAHKVSSVKDCDVIIYLDGGRITEMGTYSELLALGGTFAEIAAIQQESDREEVN